MIQVINQRATSALATSVKPANETKAARGRVPVRPFLLARPAECSSEKTPMQIEIRPIDSIKPYENNPRHNEAGIDAVAASLREFGWRQPIVVDKDDVIVVGHTRYFAAQKLGLTQIPVHVARDLTPAQARAYRIADNQTATLSSWDDDKLPIELMALQQEG